MLLDIKFFFYYLIPYFQVKTFEMLPGIIEKLREPCFPLPTQSDQTAFSVSGLKEVLAIFLYFFI